MIGIIDYGMGNVGSIRNMLRKLGHDSFIASNPLDLDKAEKLVLPGVGAFDNGMRRLESTGFIESLQDRVIQQETPILGICLGMQLLLDGSDEGERPGLSWIPGRSIRFDFSHLEKAPPVPHMGWNHLRVIGEHPIVEELVERSRFYFVHSFRVVPAVDDDALALTTYFDTEFVSVVRRRNIVGVQFHPEKSHKFGMGLLDRFARLSG